MAETARNHEKKERLGWIRLRRTEKKSFIAKLTKPKYILENKAIVVYNAV